MTEIQAIIDKLEAEKLEGSKIIQRGYDALATYDHNLETAEASCRLSEIFLIIRELKKHLPKEDKTGFILKQEYSHNGDELYGYINDGTYNFRINTTLYKIYKNDKDDVEVTFYILPRQLPTIIAALQAADEEMNDENN